MRTVEKLEPTRLAPGATARMVQGGTTRLYCVEAGQGRPVVLVGGWPQSIYCSRHVLPVLAQAHRVIALDPPGLGEGARGKQISCESEKRENNNSIFVNNAVNVPPNW